MTVLSLIGVTKHFGRKRRKQSIVKALDGVDLTVESGETVGIVGESGCGKSTLARIALKLIEPTSGEIELNGENVTAHGAGAMQRFRQNIQAVFQDPLASFNARMTISELMEEPFEAHRITPAGGVENRVTELLSAVGLGHVDTSRKPGQFSGGQLQRIAIARALAVAPQLIVADEPTSALDPSIQGQIVNLFLNIRRTNGTSFLIISHDIDIIGHLSDRIAVMYLGKIVEIGAAHEIMTAPLHPYTQALLSAAPTLKARTSKSWKPQLLGGDPPNPAAVPSGCSFHPRCPLAIERCKLKMPTLGEQIGERTVACHLAPAQTQGLGQKVGRARLGLSIGDLKREQHGIQA